METTIIQSPNDAPSAVSQAAITEAARIAAEKIENDRNAAAEDRKKLADAEHAAKVIARVNEEAKLHRERAEKAEAEKAEALKKLKEREEKDLAEQARFKELADIREKELAEERAARAKEREELRAERERERAEEQSGRILDAVTLAAVKAGILDEDDVNLSAFKEAIALAKIENGRVVGVTAAIARMKEMKPHKFKPEETPETPDQRSARESNEARATREQRLRDEASGRFVPPTPAANPSGSKNIDAATLSDADFEALSLRLRGQRV